MISPPVFAAVTLAVIEGRVRPSYSGPDATLKARYKAISLETSVISAIATAADLVKTVKMGQQSESQALIGMPPSDVNADSNLALLGEDGDFQAARMITREGAVAIKVLARHGRIIKAVARALDVSRYQSSLPPLTSTGAPFSSSATAAASPLYSEPPQV